MAEHPNVTMLRRGLEAFARRDLTTTRKLYSENLVWHYGGKGPLAGDHRGREAVFEFFTRRLELTGGTYSVEVQEYIANDDFVTALMRMTATRGWRKLDQNICWVYRVEEGKLVEAWGQPADVEAEAAFYEGVESLARER